ncbi:MAG: ABC transporter permease [Thermodesulfobacteriota bacterium]
MPSPDNQDNWTMIIRPRRGWFELNLGELWRARELVILFFWRDFVAIYKQTILGPLWFLIQPILTTVTFTIVFGLIAKLPTDGVPGFLFYMSGTVLWAYFAESLNKTSTTFISNENLFGKAYFPRLAVPLSILLSNLVTFVIQFSLFMIFLLYFYLSGSGIRPNLWMLFLPVLLLLMAGMGLGFGIIVSALTTRYRDLRFLVTFGVQLLMYATPVIYPLSSVPDAFKPFLLANPLAAVIETFRFAFLGVGTLNPWALLYSAVFTAVLLLIGILLFNHVESTFMDTV